LLPPPEPQETKVPFSFRLFLIPSLLLKIFIKLTPVKNKRKSYRSRSSDTFD